MKKVLLGFGRVLKTIREFLLAHHEFDTKTRLESSG